MFLFHFSDFLGSRHSSLLIFVVLSLLMASNKTHFEKLSQKRKRRYLYFLCLNDEVCARFCWGREFWTNLCHSRAMPHFSILRGRCRWKRLIYFFFGNFKENFHQTTYSIEKLGYFPFLSFLFLINKVNALRICPQSMVSNLAMVTL